jgi:4a-hydroxytetrahydrobiopterin dehydratase
VRKLNATETALELGALPHWTLNVQGDAITREFVLGDFMQAFAFMTQIAIAAEKHNHHPEWSNIYNRVSITWTTHDVDGLSSNDISMAQLCDQTFAGYPSAPTVA